MNQGGDQGLYLSATGRRGARRFEGSQSQGSLLLRKWILSKGLRSVLEGRCTLTLLSRSCSCNLGFFGVALKNGAGGTKILPVQLLVTRIQVEEMDKAYLLTRSAKSSLIPRS